MRPWPRSHSGRDQHPTLHAARSRSRWRFLVRAIVQECDSRAYNFGAEVSMSLGGRGKPVKAPSGPAGQIRARSRWCPKNTSPTVAGSSARLCVYSRWHSRPVSLSASHQGPLLAALNAHLPVTCAKSSQAPARPESTDSYLETGVAPVSVRMILPSLSMCTAITASRVPSGKSMTPCSTTMSPFS